MKFGIQIFGDDVINRELVRMGGRAVNARKPFREVSSRLADIERRVFDSQGRYGGGSWRRLAPATVRRKRLRRLDRRIEHATRRLRKSMIRKQHGGDAIRRVTKDSLEFGTRVKYARKQHKGYAPQNLPPRPLIKLTEHDKRDAVKKIQEHVVGSWRPGGRYV